MAGQDGVHPGPADLGDRDDHTALVVRGGRAADQAVPAERLAELTASVRDGGVVVNTVPGTPSPGDEARGVRAAGVFVRSDTAQLAHLVTLVERGELRIGVDRRVPLADLPAIHAEADAGTLRGKVVIVPTAR